MSIDNPTWSNLATVGQAAFSTLSSSMVPWQRIPGTNGTGTSGFGFGQGGFGQGGFGGTFGGQSGTPFPIWTPWTTD